MTGANQSFSLGIIVVVLNIYRVYATQGYRSCMSQVAEERFHHLFKGTMLAASSTSFVISFLLVLRAGSYSFSLSYLLICLKLRVQFCLFVFVCLAPPFKCWQLQYLAWNIEFH